MPLEQDSASILSEALKPLLTSMAGGSSSSESDGDQGPSILGLRTCYPATGPALVRPQSTRAPTALGASCLT